MRGKLHLAMRNNNGSATLVAVIAVLFIIAIGSSLLYASYIGYSVSITERANKENFYSADAQMKKVIIGVQGVLSNSLVPAYTTTLSSYASGGMSDPQIAFSQATVNNLTGMTITAGGTSTTLLSKSGANLRYSTLALACFMGTPTANSDGSATVTLGNGSKVKLSGSGTVQTAIDATGLGNLTLKDVSVEYTSPKGYVTNITTDIKIGIPVFFSVSISSDSSGYAIIAEKGLTCAIGGANSQVVGSVYAGIDSNQRAIFISGSGNVLTLSGGNVCAQGKIEVDNGGKLKFDAPNKELWANRITLSESGSGSAVALNGKIYVADDLVFAGTDSSAELSGEYFGFGSGNTPSTSSAILVNGQSSTLHISALERLSLAGISYIDISNASLESGCIAYTSPIIMGESIATKADQLTYLLPEGCLSNYYANPCVLEADKNNSGSFISPKWNPDTVLWTIGGTAKTLKYYLGDSGEKGTVIPLYTSAGTSKIAYTFIVFKTRSAANEYFKDYFTVNAQRIEQYTDLYLKDFSANAANVNSAGNTFYNDAGNKLTLYAADSTILTGDLSTRFKNKTSPFDRYVFRDMLTDNLTFKKDGKTVAVVTNGDYTFTGASSDLKLIVAKGNVKVQKSFTGMIIAGGNVAIEGTNTTVTAETLTSDILNATDSSGKSLSEYVHGLSSTDSDNAWDMNKLVVYSEWEEN